MTNFKDLNVTNSTIIELEGKEYRTTQEPFVNDEGTEYKAHAVDEANNEFMIVWDINHSDFENLEDESEACDWDNPVRVIKL